MHFKDSYQAEETINNWQGKVFGEKESVHRPRDNNGPKVGFVKNVAPRYFKHQILQILNRALGNAELHVLVRTFFL